MVIKTLRSAQDLEEAFRTWNRQIYGYVHSRVNTSQDAEDITQEAFVRAWKYRETFSPEKSSLKTWLFTLVRHVMIDWFKKNKPSEDIEEVPETFLETPAVDTVLANKDFNVFVWQQLRQLPENQQELILLFYQQELSLQEIALITKKSLSATKVALHRARERFRALCGVKKM